MNKKIIYIIVLGSLCILLLFLLLKNNINSKDDISLSFREDNLLISVGNSYKVDYLVNSKKDISNDIKFNKDNNGLEIDNLGNIKALNKGITKVFIMYDNIIYDTLNVYITDKNVSTSYVSLPSEIIINEDNINMKLNEEKVINYSLLPSNSSNDLISLSSSDPSIIEVQGNKIKAVGSGKTNIFITSVNGLSKSININVEKEDIKVQGISLLTDNFDVGVGETRKIDYIINPSNATNKDVTLFSNNALVAVTNNGEITGISKGESIITITTVDGNFSTTLKVKVRTAIDDHTIDAPKNGVGKSCNSSNSLDTTFNSCFVNSHNLYLPGIGGQDSEIYMHVGESRSIRINLPSECGRLSRWTRRSADGQENWGGYVSQSFGSADNNGYTLIITALKRGKVTLSQTVQYDAISPSGTCTGNVKSMVRINLNIS